MGSICVPGSGAGASYGEKQYLSRAPELLQGVARGVGAGSARRVFIWHELTEQLLEPGRDLCH